MARFQFLPQNQTRLYGRHRLLPLSTFQPPQYDLNQNVIGRILTEVPMTETNPSIRTDTIGDLFIQTPVIIGPRQSNRTTRWWETQIKYNVQKKDVISSVQTNKIELIIETPIIVGPRQNRNTNPYRRETDHVRNKVQKEKIVSSVEAQHIDLSILRPVIIGPRQNRLTLDCRRESSYGRRQIHGQSRAEQPLEDAEETFTGKPRKVHLNEFLHGSSKKNEICIISEDPPNEIQEKMLFLINNLSSTNIEAKAKEFSTILKEQYLPWFARYIVRKRAKLEPNFQDLYLELIDHMNLKPLNQEILDVTYETCKSMLKSEIIKSSVEERTFLNSLGRWLGKITIGRNQALTESTFNLKSLIIEAYETGSMTAVIPFISKILESIKSSPVYQPPNPWTMNILGLLVEIHSMPNLKMNLIFAIEILFRNLGFDLKQVSPTTIIKDRARLVDENPDFSTKGRRMS